MNAHKASFTNAILLVGLGIWGYFSGTSMTALIPVGFGIVLLALNSGVKKENKVIAHIAVVLTLLVLLGLIKPFLGTIERGNTLGIFRTGAMVLSTVIAMFYFIKSFIDAKKARENG